MDLISRESRIALWKPAPKRYFGNTSRETTPAYEHDGDKQSSVGWLRTLNSGLLPFVSRVDQIDADVDLYRAGRDCRFNAKRFGP
jgi:hypothetical protein